MRIRNLIHLFIFSLLFTTSAAFAWKMEADKIVVNKTTGDIITRIQFRQTYDTVPLVFTLTTATGGDSSALRVTNVSTTGFDVYNVEPDGNDGPHARMTSVPYIAIEPGTHEMPNGTRIVAGSINTQSFQSKLLTGSTWESIGLIGFNTTPTILGQIQTRTNERTDQAVPDSVSQPWMTTTISNVSSGGFDIALDRSKTTSGTISNNEKIAYLAIDSGLNNGNHYFGANNADKIEFESIRSDDIIQGWSDSTTGYVVNFSKTYPDPITVASKNTRDEDDGGWLRRRNISNNSISLVVDEDKGSDNKRNHTTERAGILLFSEPFDANFQYNSQANMVINEIMYNEVRTGNANDEFVELYVTQSGDIGGFVIADQDTHAYTFPSKLVNAGDYVIYHTGTGTNSSAAGVHHFYQGVSNIWNNPNDDVVLLKPAQDVTTLTDGKTFNAIPTDYVAYGRSSVGSNVDSIPTSMLGATVIWNYAFGTELASAGDGESIALTQNATDTNRAACWERTASGNASNNNCPGYLATVITNPTLKNSIGTSNTASPRVGLQKTVRTIYDPYNGASNPKAIPGSILEYIITAKNEGDLAADLNTTKLSDIIPNNTKLCVTDAGYCKAPYLTNATTSGLTLANIMFYNASGATVPASPDVDGANNAITRFDANTTGSFLAKTGSATPSFELRFRVVVE